MNINELMKSLSELNYELKSLIRKTKIDMYDDLSGVEADWNNPEQLFMVEELRSAMQKISEASEIISYLKKPVKGEYVLHKNCNGRYECSAHEYTCGNCIEYYAYDETEERYRWVISRVEHDGDDYYIVNSKWLRCNRNAVPLEGLRVRRR